MLSGLDAPAVLWVDAICIDPQSSFEGDHQVRLMPEIYRKATQLICWYSDEETNQRWKLLGLDLLMLDRLQQRASMRDLMLRSCRGNSEDAPPSHEWFEGQGINLCHLFASASENPLSRSLQRIQDCQQASG